MNSAILDWIQRVKDDHPKLFWKNNVVEFGSLNVNGSAREKFDEPNKYTGVDTQNGEGVDVRSYCHEFKSDEQFDVVVSTEMLEHDPYWDLSLHRMLELTKIGGSLIITSAGPARHAHGQINYTPLDRYYRNISATEIFRVISTCSFKDIHLRNKDNSFLMLFCFFKFQLEIPKPRVLNHRK